MATQAWFEKDLYAVLGIPFDADPDAVRKAYRRLARQHHPDTNAGSAVAERRFKKIGEAYGVLSDPDQRREYDALCARIHRYSRPSPPRHPGTSRSYHQGGSGGSTDGFDNLFEAWSMAWWTQVGRPTVWWGQTWWAPMWSVSSWRA
jgi:molecular chaperone DnaJ